MSLLLLLFLLLLLLLCADSHSERMNGRINELRILPILAAASRFQAGIMRLPAGASCGKQCQ